MLRSQMNNQCVVNVDHLRNVYQKVTGSVMLISIALAVLPQLSVNQTRFALRTSALHAQAMILVLVLYLHLFVHL